MQLQKFNNKIYFGAKFDEASQKEFMQLAREKSKESPCKRLQVGAVVLSSDGLVSGKGCNIVPEGVLSCRDIGNECIRSKFKIPSGQGYDKACFNVHAEQEALLEAGLQRAKNGTLFLAGHKFMCNDCTLKVIKSKIQDVYIQFLESDPIQHFSLEDLIKQVNEKFKADIKYLAENAGKTLK